MSERASVECATSLPSLTNCFFAEMYKLAAQTAAQADLDWTIFRVMFLTSGPADLPVHAAPELTPHFPGGVAISRASIARWVLGELAHPQWIRAAPMISN